MKKILSTLLFLVFCNISFAQHWYDVHLDPCNTERFALESKTETARINPDTLKDFFLENSKIKELKKLKGILRLQIIVYSDGTSCLLSYTNDTNKTPEEIGIINLKEAISKELKWNIEDESVSVFLEVKFKKNKLSFNRLGFDANLGRHRLRR